mmetsp:Transcript_33455/g.49519  ORF Transcript_33455/g.49519 Transcript_33455/m.49519 type:complete len:271 (+) Transcript_33455:257-1069(+)
MPGVCPTPRLRRRRTHRRPRRLRSRQHLQILHRTHQQDFHQHLHLTRQQDLLHNQYLLRIHRHIHRHIPLRTPLHIPHRSHRPCQRALRILHLTRHRHLPHIRHLIHHRHLHPHLPHIPHRRLHQTRHQHPHRIPHPHLLQYQYPLRILRLLLGPQLPRQWKLQALQRTRLWPRWKLQAQQRHLRQPLSQRLLRRLQATRQHRVLHRLQMVPRRLFSVPVLLPLIALDPRVPLHLLQRVLVVQVHPLQHPIVLVVLHQLLRPCLWVQLPS